MVLQTTGQISLSNLQTEFGGTNPINFSEYYLNASTAYTNGVSGIPNIGTQISLSQFYGKAKAVVNFMLQGNASGNMSTSVNINGQTLNSTSMGIDGADDSSASIGTMNFPFFFFGVDYNNNIFWSSNQVLQFGTNVGTINWSATTGRGILLGNFDRRANSTRHFPTYIINNHSIKRLSINHANSYSLSGSEIQMEIRLIRGPQYQYVEIRMAQWTARSGGNWNLTNGSSYYNVFSGAPPVGTGASVVLRSDLNGNGWQAFNNHYVNL
jgi:hypothetical protein